MAKYDPTKQEDWQIGELAEEELDFNRQCDKIGILPEERIPMGRKIGRVEYMKVLERLKGKKDGYYIDITAITPTPLGEGKTVTTMGLIEGLGKRGMNVGGCHPPALRRPHHEHQGHRRRQRHRPIDSHDRFFPGPHRGHQRRHDRQ